MKRYQLYYVEDDGDIAQTVREYLEHWDFNVSVFSTLASAKKALAIQLPDIVLADWNMPDGHGSSLCQWIRGRWQELPIILLTVRGDTRDIVTGFENGADDYVVKPFELEILYSRIGALLRRSGNVSGQYLSCGSVSVDQSRMMVFCEGEEVSLSQAEYHLLLLLLQNKEKTVTRERLLEQIWDSNGNYVNDNTLTVTMKRLREKLKHPSCLRTVRSFGYRMEERE